MLGRTSLSRKTLNLDLFVIIELILINSIIYGAGNLPAQVGRVTFISLRDIGSGNV
jgi:hypothetical protein